MGVSLKDVALHAGVSVKTVSNVVNDYPHVTAATRERVQRSIDELGYRPNLMARHLRKGRTGIITLAVPELGNPYFAEVAGAVVDAAARHDLTVLLDHTAGLREKEVLVTRGFRSHIIDGLILSPIRLEREDLLARTGGPPMVLLGERDYGAPYDHIMIDNVSAARAAVRHLLDIGRRRVAFLGARHESARQPGTCACAAGARPSPTPAAPRRSAWSWPPTATTARTAPTRWAPCWTAESAPTPSSPTTT